MKKKSVVFVAASTQGGGAERMQINIMHSLSIEKYDVFFVNTSSEPKPQTLKPHITYIQYNKSHAKSAYRLLSKELKDINPHYIFTTSIVVAYLLQIIRMMSRLKSRLIVRIAVPPSESPHKGVKSAILSRMNSFTLKHADLIIAQTEFSKIDVARHYKVPLTKIKVIRNIVDQSLLDESGALYFPGEFSSGNYNIVAAGALYSVKGFDLLIHAMKEVVKHNITTRLYILGDERYETGYKAQLSHLIQEHQLTNHVFLLGHQSNPYPYYKNADLFVLSSRKEGFPNVVLEALYYGIPVVATNCVDFSEVINNGVNGYIVPKDSVNDLSEGVIKAIEHLKKTTTNKIDNYNYEQIFS
ncbi:glycosyltransferase [Flavobacterium supellecticarium]|uniref:Glycosyltransferase n=1 Tax=Flavobacterium supellecticarium TaxID=2565924 RepID=A0A4S3ZXH3_9FLAO|nr:glycosyltransferase [Flavobacterium supellecticarium]THF50555.1 glycosyltransferase [Flavobacterium supellecticarium]